LAASVIVPFFGPLIGLLGPLPYIYYSMKLGLRQGAVITALTLAALTLFSATAGFPRLPLVAVEFGVVGWGLAMLFRMRLGIGLTILLGTCLMLSIGVAFLLTLSFMKGMGFFELVREYMQTHLEATMAMYGSGGGGARGGSQLTEAHKAVIEGIMNLFPSLGVIGASFSVWLNVVSASALLRRSGLSAPDFGRPELWRAPENLVWILIVAGFSLFLASGGLKYLALNLFLVVAVVYLYQGMAIVLFFLKKYDVPGWMRPLIYFFLVVQQVLTVVVAAGGLFDQWIDFRKIHKRRGLIS